MTAVPYWASKELVAAVKAERPTYRITTGHWIEGGGVRRYTGSNAAKLRRLYTAEMMRLIDQGLCPDEIHHRLECDADELVQRLVPDEPLVWIGGERLPELKRTGTGGWL